MVIRQKKVNSIQSKNMKPVTNLTFKVISLTKKHI